jgi:hypothetical protein
VQLGRDRRGQEASMTDRNEPRLPLSRLEEAVARGIITAQQLDALRAMSPSTEREEPPEARRGLNAVSIAYYIGAAAVVFAFGWFIIDRWEMLGPAGVLTVSLLYAAIFTVTARAVGRLGFRTASALAVLLATTMAPVVMWSLLRLTGLWYEPDIHRGLPYVAPVDVLETLRWIPLDLAVALAALVALRRVHFALLALPVAIALPLTMGHAMPLFLDPDIMTEMLGWITLVSGGLLLACGYRLDRHPRDDQDYAGWVYLVGLLAIAFALIDVWHAMGYLRHGLPLLAAGFFALALLLHRRIFTIFGALAVVVYLAYLAFDVFREAVSFPIVLATFGMSVIVLTVLLQRRYPALARQVEGRQRGQRVVPHAGLVFGGAITVTLALLLVQLPGAQARAAEGRLQARQHALDAYRAQQHRARPDSPRPPVSR